MARKFYDVPTSSRQRQLLGVVLEDFKKLAQNVASGCARLQIPDGAAMNVVGNIAHLRGLLDQVLPAETGTKSLKMDHQSCDVLKGAIRYWAATTLKKDNNLQLSLASSGRSSEMSKAEDAMQKLMDSVNDQLSLPFEPIEAPEKEDEDDGSDGTHAGPHRGVGKNRKPEDTPEGAKKMRLEK